MNDSGKRYPIFGASMLKSGVTTGNQQMVAAVAISNLKILGSRDANNYNIVIDLTSASPEAVETTKRNLLKLGINLGSEATDNGLIEVDNNGVNTLIKAGVHTPVIDAIAASRGTAQGINEVAAASLSQLHITGESDGKKPTATVSFSPALIRLVYKNLDSLSLREEDQLISASDAKSITFNKFGVEAAIKAGVTSPVFQAMLGVTSTNRSSARL